MISQVLADLKADSTLNGLINGRIYRSILPDNPTYPLVLFETEKEVENTLSGESSLQHNIFDFMIMGVSYVECKDIFNALNTALVVSNNFRHTMLAADDGEFNDEIEQYLLNARSSIWKVNQDIPPTYNTIFTDATIDDISYELLADIAEVVIDGLPPGPTGPQGPEGPTGPQGPAGADGSDGAEGPQGPAGPTGPTGATGPAGADGSDGADGQGVPTGGTAGQVLSKIDGTDYSTQWVDDQTGLLLSAVQDVAVGASLGLEQSLLANAGQAGLTVLAVAYTTSGKVQGVSLGAGNVVEVYADGTAYNAGNVLYREFMQLGEPICFTGLTDGAIIVSTQGFYGFSEQVDGSNESPMPLLSYGLSFKRTFLYAFRDSQDYQTGQKQGWIHVVNGPLDNVIKLTDGSGTTIRGQENISLTPWEFRRIFTDGNQEYILSGTQRMMAAINARMGAPRFFDSRLIMPLTNDGITWPRSGQVSAPYNNTQVAFYVRDGVKGTLNGTTGVSPGSPVDFDAPPPTGTGADEGDYESDGCTRVLATGLISAFSGADSAGLEATPLMPVSGMSQVVAQPLYITDTGDGGNSSVAIASPYAGTAKVYSWDSSTSSLVLEYTVPLTRGSAVSVTSREDQYHPAAGQIANETSASNQLVGQLNPGVIIADVPITVVVQSASTPSLTLRSQNGSTTSPIASEDDETLSLGITPSHVAAEIREDAAGLWRIRRINSSGVESWDVG